MEKGLLRPAVCAHRAHEIPPAEQRLPEVLAPGSGHAEAAPDYGNGTPVAAEFHSEGPQRVRGLCGNVLGFTVPFSMCGLF
jgi:hypothetical protein